MKNLAPLVAIVSSLVLAGCSTAATPEAAGSSSSVGATSSSSAAAAATPGATSAATTQGNLPQLGADRDAQASCSAAPAPVDPENVSNGQRKVVTANGDITVPADPQRIVVLDTDKLDVVCALGLQSRLVGAATPAADTNQPEYLGDVIEAVPTVGTLQEPDLEKIAALKPDLIIGSKFRTQKLYVQLTKIAPTAFTAEVGTPWRENVISDGTALGRKASATAALAKYTTRAAALKTTLSSATTTVSIVRFMSDKIRIYGPTSFSGSVLEESGVKRPTFQQLNGAKDRRFVAISGENIEQAAADTVFVAAYGAKGVAASTEALQQPLWRSLDAAKQGRIFVVSDETWMTGIGVIAAQALLDDLEKTLT